MIGKKVRGDGGEVHPLPVRLNLSNLHLVSGKTEGLPRFRFASCMSNHAATWEEWIPYLEYLLREGVGVVYIPIESHFRVERDFCPYC